jgi:thiamine biosynthesis lipoprotein
MNGREKRVFHVVETRRHMATDFRFVLSVSSALRARAVRALTSAHEAVARLEAELSEFDPESPIYLLNRAPPLTKVLLPPSAQDLWRRAMQLREASSGAFDPTARSEVGSAGFHWDTVTGRAWRKDEGARVGFGAIGKGYALDQVRQFLEREGFSDFMLEAGGSSAVLLGFAAPNEPWRIGWTWRKGGEPTGLSWAHGSGTRLAYGVSGTQEQGEHLLDPRTGQAASRDSVSALVVDQDATSADALSTALYVDGWEESVRKLRTRLHPPGLAWIGKYGQVRWNGVFESVFPRALAGALGLFLSWSAKAQELEEAIDLADLGLHAFTPYSFQRDPMWILLPVLTLGVVLLHLKRSSVRRRDLPPLDPRYGPAEGSKK